MVSSWCLVDNSLCRQVRDGQDFGFQANNWSDHHDSFMQSAHTITCVCTFLYTFDSLLTANESRCDSEIILVDAEFLLISETGQQLVQGQYPNQFGNFQVRIN